jgi:hypothetical protein
VSVTFTPVGIGEQLNERPIPPTVAVEEERFILSSMREAQKREGLNRNALRFAR